MKNPGAPNFLENMRPYNNRGIEVRTCSQNSEASVYIFLIKEQRASSKSCDEAEFAYLHLAAFAAVGRAAITHS